MTQYAEVWQEWKPFGEQTSRELERSLSMLQGLRDSGGWAILSIIAQETVDGLQERILESRDNSDVGMRDNLAMRAELRGMLAAGGLLEEMISMLENEIAIRQSEED